MSHHGFAFGGHYDPERLSFGPMVCHDDHLLGSGRGFDEHAHEGLEIVTWVVSGAVEHLDSLGGSVVLRAGECGVLSAGAGVRHAERATPDGPARFVQVWLTPATPDRAPSYARAEAGLASEPDPAQGGPSGPVPVVGHGGPLAVDVPGAAFGVARLDAGEAVEIPAAARAHVFVATGALLRSSLAEPLSAGDAFLMTDEAPHTLTAAVPTHLLVWTFSA
ncbi:pirin family protein [Nocardioides sp. SYSU DS0651]|uniref:pirin family protein n=1 Tax=Nocardioides sp. SYSU DS0651 TaxID=3415955 RepID=UPI003F4B3CD5